jgi:hypothetical protein
MSFTNTPFILLVMGESNKLARLDTFSLFKATAGIPKKDTDQV